jgi:hypothetical protein
MRSVHKINFQATELINKLSFVLRINNYFVSKYYYTVVIVTHIRIFSWRQKPNVEMLFK